MFDPGDLSLQLNLTHRLCLNSSNKMISVITEVVKHKVMQYLLQLYLCTFLPRNCLVGDGGLEPPTSSLSVTRSNQLS